MKKVILFASVIGLFTVACDNQAEIEAAKQETADSIARAEAIQEEQEEASNNSTTTVIYRDQPNGTSTTTYVEEPDGKQKEGMGNVTKGALIGAGVGAITGAAVSKDKKGKGALIGAGAGAVAGAGTGVIINKRKDRDEE